MGDRRDGGPAFPNVNSDERVGVYVGDEGMSLRDYFAAKAIPAAMEIVISMGGNPHVDMLARTAYRISDEMLNARKRFPSK